MPTEKKTFIWTVSRGEINQGGRILGIFAKKEDAEKRALKEKVHFSGGWEEWDRDTLPPSKIIKSWFNGCDFIEIQRWELNL